MQADDDDDDPADDDGGDHGNPAATLTASATVVPVDFNGTWHTNSSLVELTQTGNQVTGQYRRYTANPPLQTLEGTVEGRTVKGLFDGRFEFAFTVSDDGEYIDGYWIGSNGDENEWCGNLFFEEQQVDCGYSGGWIVKGLPESIELQDGVIWITQLSDRARVELTSARYGPATIDMSFDETILARAAGTLTLQTPANPTLQFEITFLVSEFKDWSAFRGTWRQTLPAGGLAGEWCAYRESTAPPC